MPSLPTGPTASTHDNSTGDTTVTPESQTHTATVVFSGLGTARNVILGTTGLDVGARLNVLAVWAAGAANDMAITVKNVNGTQLFTFTRAGSEANALFKCECMSPGGLRAIEQTIPAYPVL